MQKEKVRKPATEVCIKVYGMHGDGVVEHLQGLRQQMKNTLNIKMDEFDDDTHGYTCPHLF